MSSKSFSKLEFSKNLVSQHSDNKSITARDFPRNKSPLRIYSRWYDMLWLLVSTRNMRKITCCLRGYLSILHFVKRIFKWSQSTIKNKRAVRWTMTKNCWQFIHNSLTFKISKIREVPEASRLFEGRKITLFSKFVSWIM